MQRARVGSRFERGVGSGDDCARSVCVGCELRGRIARGGWHSRTPGGLRDRSREPGSARTSDAPTWRGGRAVSRPQAATTDQALLACGSSTIRRVICGRRCGLGHSLALARRRPSARATCGRWHVSLAVPRSRQPHPDFIGGARPSPFLRRGLRGAATLPCEVVDVRRRASKSHA